MSPWTDRSRVVVTRFVVTEAGEWPPTQHQSVRNTTPASGGVRASAEQITINSPLLRTTEYSVTDTIGWVEWKSPDRQLSCRSQAGVAATLTWWNDPSLSEEVNRDLSESYCSHKSQCPLLERTGEDLGRTGSSQRMDGRSGRWMPWTEERRRRKTGSRGGGQRQRGTDQRTGKMQLSG